PQGRGDRRGFGNRLRRRAASARFHSRPASAARLSAAGRTELFADAASAVSAISGATGLSAAAAGLSATATGLSGATLPGAATRSVPAAAVSAGRATGERTDVDL